SRSVGQHLCISLKFHIITLFEYKICHRAVFAYGCKIAKKLLIDPIVKTIENSFSFVCRKCSRRTEYKTKLTLCGSDKFKSEYKPHIQHFWNHSLIVVQHLYISVNSTAVFIDCKRTDQISDC